MDWYSDRLARRCESRPKIYSYSVPGLPIVQISIFFACFA